MKKLISIFMVVLLGVGIILPSVSTDTFYAAESNVDTYNSIFEGKITDSVTDDKAYDLMLSQENALFASEALMKAFGSDENGTVVYPDDYAGSWIDNDVLIISLTDISNETKAKYDDWIGEYAEYVQYEKAEFSYNYLKSKEESIVENLEEENNIEIVGYTVSQRDNEVVVEVEADNSVSRSLNTLEEDIVDGIPVSIVEVSDAELAYNLYGGNGISNLSTGASFTLSCCGTYNGSSTVLTCGHDSSQAVGQSIKDVSSGRTIGSIVYRRYSSGGYGDFEIVSVANSSFTTTNRVLTGDSLIGSIYYPSVGTTVKFFGSSTGRVCYGTVTETGVTRSYANGINIKGLTKVEITSGSVTQGDSGAPFVIAGSDGTRFGGLLHGYSTSLTKVYVYFTPYGYINSAGFSVQWQ